ncbi:MAG: hypothetical protein ACO2YZ_00005, partial [Litorivicinaceae bacterium]
FRLGSRSCADRGDLPNPWLAPQTKCTTPPVLAVTILEPQERQKQETLELGLLALIREWKQWSSTQSMVITRCPRAVSALTAQTRKLLTQSRSWWTNFKPINDAGPMLDRQLELESVLL